MHTGYIYYWGQGVAVDYKRALAAYKLGAKGGNAHCQNQLGYMHSHEGYGVDPPDLKQALVWYEMAAAQDRPAALVAVGCMVEVGDGAPPSWRRAREYFQRAINLGHPRSAEYMQSLNKKIQQVTRGHTDAGWLYQPDFNTPPNLPPPQIAPLMDRRIEIYGTTRHDMNGKRGVTTDFHPLFQASGDVLVEQSRYTVLLDSGETYKFRPTAVRAEQVEAADGAPPKAKGKGKKGRGKGR